MLLFATLLACDPKPASTGQTASSPRADATPTSAAATLPGTPATMAAEVAGPAGSTETTPPAAPAETPPETPSPASAGASGAREKSAKVDREMKAIDAELEKQAGLLKILGTTGGSSSTAADLWSDPHSMDSIQNALAGASMVESGARKADIGQGGSGLGGGGSLSGLDPQPTKSPAETPKK